MQLYLILIIVFVIITVIVVTVLVCKDSIMAKLQKEGFVHSRAGYCPTMQGIMLSAGSSKVDPEKPAYEVSGGEEALMSSNTPAVMQFKQGINEAMPANESSQRDSNMQQKETFFSLGEKALVNSQNVIEGARIHTNGILDNNVTYNDLVTNIQNNQVASDGAVAGASRGNDFADIWSAYQKTQDEHNLNPTSVRTPEEIDEITKDINMAQNLASNNYLSRGGANKGKIKLEPWNTVGVIDGKIDTPERDINHKIYSVNHCVPIKSYELDSFDVVKEFTKDGPGFAKSFADNNTKKVITGFGEDAAKYAQIVE